jgi:hypothetical protein
MARNDPWTVEAGRQICFHGEPFISIGRGDGNTSPAIVDGATHAIVELLNGVDMTPDEIHRRHVGGAPSRELNKMRYPKNAARESREVRSGRQVREDDRKYSMSYGKLPPFEQFEYDVHTRSDPEHDGQPYWPPGTLYPMELVESRASNLSKI